MCPSHRITRINKYVPDMGSSLSGFASKLADGRDSEAKNKYVEEGAEAEQGEAKGEREDVDAEEGKREEGGYMSSVCVPAPRETEREGGCRKIGKIIRTSDQAIRRAAGSGGDKRRRAKKQDVISTDGDQQRVMMGGELLHPCAVVSPLIFLIFGIGGQIATWRGRDFATRPARGPSQIERGPMRGG